jgi:hypothetical protein
MRLASGDKSKGGQLRDTFKGTGATVVKDGKIRKHIDGGRKLYNEEA